MRAFAISAWVLLAASAAAVAACSGERDDASRVFPATSEPGATSPASNPTPETEPSGLTQPDPWPPLEVQERAIAIVRAHLGDDVGVRYGAFEINEHRDQKDISCEGTTDLPCLEVGLYDYEAAIGIKAVVDVAHGNVIHTQEIAEFQPGPSEDDVTRMVRALGADPGFGPDFRADTALAGMRQIDDTDLGGECGQMSPLHRCLMLKGQDSDGPLMWVTVDLVTEQVVRAYPDEQLTSP